MDGEYRFENKSDGDVLNEIEYLLRCMYLLASRSASDACDDRERVKLQKELRLLRILLDRLADQYHGGILNE